MTALLQLASVAGPQRGPGSTMPDGWDWKCCGTVPAAEKKPLLSSCRQPESRRRDGNGPNGHRHGHGVADPAAVSVHPCQALPDPPSRLHVWGCAAMIRPRQHGGMKYSLRGYSYRSNRPKIKQTTWKIKTRILRYLSWFLTYQVD